MSVPPGDIFGKKKRTRDRINIPSTLANNMDDIPQKIIIKFSDTIDLLKIDEIMIHKYNVLKKLGKDVTQFDNYLKNKAKLLDLYNVDCSTNVLQEYIDLCSECIEIEFIRNYTVKLQCKACKLEISSDDEMEDCTYTCPECSCINHFLKPHTYNRTANLICDEDINNFMKVLDKFEGKTDIYPPDTLYDELDVYFMSVGMHSGEYYRDLPLSHKGTKENTSKKKLWMALEVTGNNKYYDEINFIAHVYWGWTLPDITLYRDQLVNDYIKTQAVWSRIKQKYNRTASLGTQFRLYVHLKAIDYECERDDFKIQDMVESLRLHNEAWKTMCAETGVKYNFVS
jgi:hypothetical protein